MENAWCGTSWMVGFPTVLICVPHSPGLWSGTAGWPGGGPGRSLSFGMRSVHQQSDVGEPSSPRPGMLASSGRDGCRGRVWAHKPGTFSTEIQTHLHGAGRGGSVVLRVTSRQPRKPAWILLLHLCGHDTRGPRGGTAGESNGENGCIQLRRACAHRRGWPRIIPPSSSLLRVLGPLHE